MPQRAMNVTVHLGRNKNTFNIQDPDILNMLKNKVRTQACTQEEGYSLFLSHGIRHHVKNKQIHFSGASISSTDKKISIPHTREPISVRVLFTVPEKD